jgi:hypothetical protein
MIPSARKLSGIPRWINIGRKIINKETFEKVMAQRIENLDMKNRNPPGRRLYY